MAGPPTAAFSQLTVRYSGYALPFGAVTTHGFTTPTGPVGDVYQAIEDFADVLKSQIVSGVLIQDVLWKVGPVATGPTVVVPIGVPGDLSGSGTSPNVTSLTHLPVEGLSGRFAGRFFMPGMREQDVDDAGIVASGYRTSLQAAIQLAYESMAAVGAGPRVFSQRFSDPGVVEIENIQVDGRAATQRRRMRR